MLWSAPDDPDLKYFREEGHIVAEGLCLREKPML
jgi:hypothetical protein